MIAHSRLDQLRRFGAGQPVLGLALELRIADEDGEHQLAAGHHIVGGDVLRLLDADQLAKGADALHQRGAQPRFMRAAIRRGDGVGVPAIAAVRPERPGDRPFGATHRAREILRAGEEIPCRALPSGKLLGEVIGEAAGKLEHRLCGRIVADQLGRAFPADFDAREEIGLGARQPVEPRGLEMMGAENLDIRHEADGSAAPVRRRADLFEPALHQSPAEGLAE